MISETQFFDALCYERFDVFAQRAFAEIEPGVKYEWNWHIECISDHLQSLYEGTLPDGKRRLCINIPPRSLKSYLASIAFPAWVMGREPHNKFITTSFNATLAKEMAQKSRILIESEWYKNLFPHMRLDERQNEKHNFWTTERGMYYSSAIMSVTGRGANYCFVGETKICTQSGYLYISDIKEGDLVWSYNHVEKRTEIQRVSKIFSRKVSELVCIETAKGRRIICTPDHPFWIEERGYVKAIDLSSMDRFVTLGIWQNKINALYSGMRFLHERICEIKSRLPKVTDSWAQRFLLFKSLLKATSQFQEQKTLRYVWGENSIKDKEILYFMQSKKEIRERESIFKSIQGHSFFDRISRQVRMLFLQYQEEKNSSSSRFEKIKQLTRKLNNYVFVLSQKTSSIFFGDNVRSIEPYGHGENTVHDITVERNHNFYAEGILVHNCTLDDPINPKEAISDTIRQDTNATIRSTIPTRFNDLRNDKWLLIMQRVHADDPTGHFALSDPRWFILKLPGENRTEKPITYTLGNKTWVMKPGELLFPQRLTRQVLDDLNTDLGEYNYAGQILQEPVPIGGGAFKPEWIQYYAPGGCKPTTMNICILVDPAGGEELNKKKKKLSDWTAMMVVGLAPDNNRYLLDIIRDRLNPTERVNTLFMLHRKWNAHTGKSPKVGYERYGMMADTHYIEAKKKEDAYNFPLIELGGTTPKEDRIKQLIPDMQNGHWFFPQNLIYVDGEGRRFDLVQELVQSEMPHFPRAKHDDMLDALSRIYEPSLNMVFPKPKIGMVSKARKAMGGTTDGWESW